MNPCVRYVTVILLFCALPLFGAGEVRAAKVVVILSRTAGPYMEALQGFQQLNAFETEIVNLEGDLEKGRQFLKKATASEIQAVVFIGTEAVSLMDSLNTDVPAVYTMVLEPADSIKRKANGILIKMDNNDQLIRIRKLFPNRKRLGIMYNPQNSKKEIEEIRGIIPKYNLVLFPIAIENSGEVPTALTKFSKDTVDLIWMIFDRTLSTPSVTDQFIQHTSKNGLPLIGISIYQVKNGCLAAFSADFRDVGMQTAVRVQKIIAGGDSARNENPRKVVVYWNSKVQKQMGFEEPANVPDLQLIQP
jgi:ABC-type uncharacterized transport system substrate-binding protein